MILSKSVIAWKVVRGGLVAVAALLCCVFWSERALAQPTAQDRAAAEALFDEAVKLLESGNPASACPKLEDSQRLDPGVGTLLYLADCYQQVGRIASAWATFREAAYAARSAGQYDREQTATASADALKPRLHYLVLQVAQPDTAGMLIRRGDQMMGKALWTSPVPLDPGEHQLEVTATDKKPWTGTFTIPAEPGTTTVDVPALEDAPPPPPSQTPTQVSSPPVQDKPESSNTQRTIGWIAVGAGGGSFIAAGVFSLLAMNDNSAANDECVPSDPTLCNARGRELGESAVSKANVAAVFTGVGAALAVGGVVLVLTAPSAESDAALNVSAQVGTVTGLSLNGAW